ncbi:DsbA family protein [Amycolatopsis anabasis]|uniref:DsbA family protein n=1 Tax=Amycolatopsis anabasis TaxID=1840409 RepID=UPI00131AA230|nr:thioredoxin domain-containing protein [Amycolatopsis anabasis]
MAGTGNRKRSKGAKAVAAARPGARRSTIVAVVAVVLLAAGVIAGVYFTKSKTERTAEQAIPVVSKEVGYPVARDGGTVLAGKDTAKLTVDVYADFLCPACGQFEKANSADLERNLNAGTIKVRYHMLPMLNSASNPPGYSLDSANAALAAADGGKFVQFHDSLFGSQPDEGGRGYDKQQLIALGRALGLGDDFAQAVTSGKYDQEVNAGMSAAEQAPHLQATRRDGSKGFRGTPTVAVGDQVVDTSVPGWLDGLIKAAGNKQ